jgi:hypothetical protein
MGAFLPKNSQYFTAVFQIVRPVRGKSRMKQKILENSNGFFASLPVESLEKFKSASFP